MKHSHLVFPALYGSCLLTACGGGGPSDPAVEPATHLTVTAPPTATAGTAFNLMVTALDAANHVVASYSGPVHFSSTDNQAVLPANSKLTNGTGSFSATLGTGGSQNITATDTVTASITGISSAIDVSDPATHLSVSALSTTVAGTSFKVTVTALDAANKVVAGYSGTVHLSSSDHQAMLQYDSKLTNGTGRFSATLRTVGSQTITATDTVTASIAGTSNSISVYASSRWGYCAPPGSECLSSPCCPGLVCRPATNRSYCEAASAAASSATSKSAVRLAALFPQAPTTSPNSAPTSAAMHHHYVMIDVGTFGGPTSGVASEPEQNVINGPGTIVGGADTSLPTQALGCYNPIGNPDCLVIHAFAWRAGILRDLGSLPGTDYSYALEINERGQIVGVSETGDVDPTTGVPEFHAVLWEKDKIHDLGTLGGTASFAEVLNNRGQIVGNSLNSIPDPLSIMASGAGNLTLTQTHGFIWQDGKMQDLGTLGGPDSWASFINERGQVAGASYTDDVVDPNTGTPQIDLFIWQDGKMQDLGNLGGNSGYVGLPGIVRGINDRGEVTGGMTLADGQTVDAFLWDGHELLDLGSLGGGSYAEGINNSGEVAGITNFRGNQNVHGFLWRDGVMIDLGTLGDDPCNVALALNSKGQVIGASESLAGGCEEWTTAFLWENGGPMVDLNALVPLGSGVHLTVALAINEHGEIVAAGAPPGCDVLNAGACQHIYALIPCDENHPRVDGCDYRVVEADSPSATRPTREAPARSPAHDETELSPSEARARFLSMIRGHRRFGMLLH